MRGKARCRLHGGHSTGPRTLEGLARLRAAKTQHRRFSLEGLAWARWTRAYFRNGYRSIRAFEHGTIRGVNGRAYFARILADEAANGLPADSAAERTRAVRAALERDLQRLRRKGLVRQPHET